MGAPILAKSLARFSPTPFSIGCPFQTGMAWRTSFHGKSPVTKRNLSQTERFLNNTHFHAKLSCKKTWAQRLRLLFAGRALKAPGQLSGRCLACATGNIWVRWDKRLRLCAGAWPHGPCRLLAFRKGGGLHPRHAGFLPAARPERAQQSPRRGRVLSSRSSAALRRCVAARAMPPSCVPQGRGLHPRHAGLLRSARPERSPRN